MLEFNNVSVQYGKKKILEDISFSLQPGQITVLLGRNGTGKTSLLRCVSGLQKYQGQILLGNRELSQWKIGERAREIAVLPQVLPVTGYTVEALVALGRNPYVKASGRLNAKDVAIVKKAIEDTGMTPWVHQPCHTLSGGERQRAFLAMLLAQKAKIMMMDEPATYMDVDARRKMYDMIKKLAKAENKTLLVVMHDLNEALQLADDVVILAEKKVCFQGNVQECLRQEALEKYFGVVRHVAVEEGRETVFFC